VPDGRAHGVKLNRRLSLPSAGSSFPRSAIEPLLLQSLLLCILLQLLPASRVVVIIRRGFLSDRRRRRRRRRRQQQRRRSRTHRGDNYHRPPGVRRSRGTTADSGPSTGGAKIEAHELVPPSGGSSLESYRWWLGRSASRTFECPPRALQSLFRWLMAGAKWWRTAALASRTPIPDNPPCQNPNSRYRRQNTQKIVFRLCWCPFYST
jgi:hypothetical protein